MASPDDYIVEIRDVNFNRLGQIDGSRLNLLYTEIFNGVGTFQLTLPAGHPLLAAATTKGAGIIITHIPSGRVFSGRIQGVQLSQKADDPKGTWVITGSDDNVTAAATVCYPTPSAEANAQTASAYWTMTDNGESVMKALVQQNIGPSALADRKYAWLSIAANSNRGATVGASLRFDNMGTALQTIATSAKLGFKFTQSGTGVVFDVYALRDQSALVRLNIANGGLQENDLGWTAPTATIALVMGQGEGTARTILPVTHADATADATAWGIRYEQAIDQRQTNDPVQLQQAGDDAVTAAGTTVYTTKVTPSSSPGMNLGVDWYLGDTITVVMNGQETKAQVTQVAVSITSAGVIQQASVGDPTGFDWDAQVGKSIGDLDTRVSSLEANSAVTTTTYAPAWGPWVQLTNGVNMTLGANIGAYSSAATYGQLAYRVAGNRVAIRGILANTAAINNVSGILLLTLTEPTILPKFVLQNVGQISGGVTTVNGVAGAAATSYFTRMLYLNTSGALSMYGTGTTQVPSGTVFVFNFEYWLD